jgi:membrane protein implicated in regulation of membrane protease activity
MIIDYINSHHGEFWIALGFLLLIIEVLVMGMASGVLLFAGLGALATGLLMLAGILPTTWLAGVASVGVSSGIITALLWRPLRRLQGGHAPVRDHSSDFIGLEFVLEQEITSRQPGQTRYSGVTWRVELDPDAGVEAIAAGQRVAVTSLDAGIFRVKPV